VEDFARRVLKVKNKKVITERAIEPEARMVKIVENVTDLSRGECRNFGTQDFRQADNAGHRRKELMGQLSRHQRAELVQPLIFHAPANGGAFETRFHTFEQVFQVNRLHEKVIGPFFHALARGDQIRSSRHQDELPRLQHRITPNFAQERGAVTAGHLNIAENQIGEMLMG
jgi:hypothetical protein